MNEALTRVTFCVALALAGCTLEPTYVRPAAPVAQTFPSESSARAPSGLLPLAANLGWRDFLKDPKLVRLVELALQNNRDLRVAALNIDASRAQLDAARSGLYPQAAAGFSATREHGMLANATAHRSELDLYQPEVTLSWQIDLFGRVRSLSHVALDQYLATEQAREAVQISLVGAVANQYLTILADDEALSVTDSALQIAQESYRITTLRFQNGVGSELDVREAETALEQARGQLAQQQRARSQAQNALVLLIGQPLPNALPTGSDLEAQQLVADIPAGLPSALIERRPDIVQAEDQLKAANANIGAARAAFFPSISLTGLAGAVSPVLGNLFHAGTGFWDFAGSATTPIFTGGLNSANLSLAKTQRAVAVATYEKAIQTAFREVADGLIARTTYEDQLASANRLVVAQQKRYDLSQLRYKNGVDAYLTVLQAQIDLNNAQLARVTTQLQRSTNLVTLYQALGGGWLEHSDVATAPAVDAL